MPEQPDIMTTKEVEAFKQAMYRGDMSHADLVRLAATAEFGARKHELEQNVHVLFESFSHG